MQTNTILDVWPNSVRHVWHWTRKGFGGDPVGQLREGKRPPQTCARDPGEWPHGWQYWASSVLDSCYRKVSFLSGRSAACQAHLRSHSGCNAGLALAHAPTAREFTITSTPFPCVAPGEAPSAVAFDRGDLRSVP